MSEVMKDSAIKLFGKTIILLSENRQSSFTSSTSMDSKDESGGEFTCIKDDQYDTSSEIDDETNTIQVEAPSPKDSNTPEETTLKKPDKILPCPRCNSTDTKFCYYNNYNVNQPRYFCRNCQRYWTSGGTMRNVPVGSGRRKNKNTIVPSFGHIIVSDALQTPMNGFLISPNSGFYPATTYWNVPAVSTATSPVSCLGKHSREGDMVKASNSGNLDGERSVLIPKTLRIHDPSEAAKSSIWSTLGIKYEKSGPLSGTGLFKAFDSKGDHRRSIDNRTMVLHTNPAALSRSVNFHESA